MEAYNLGIQATDTTTATSSSSYLDRNIPVDLEGCFGGLKSTLGFLDFLYIPSTPATSSQDFLGQSNFIVSSVFETADILYGGGGIFDLDYSVILISLKSMIEKGQLQNARRVIESLELLGTPYPEKISNFVRVLEQPHFHVCEEATGAETLANKRWLRENAVKYRTKWVALSKGSLVYESDTRQELQAYIEKMEEQDKILVLKIPKK